MIPRRIAEHVRAHNWFAVAIDFVIVVVGVFLGIQMSNWNGVQADRRLGGDYAARLANDLSADLEDTKTLVAYYADVLESVQRTNALLNRPDADPEALVVQAYRASEVNYFPPTRATWDEIVSSGHLGLLPEGAIESGLPDYFAFDTPLSQFEDLNHSEYRRIVRQAIPLELQQAIRAGCSDVRSETQAISGFMEKCELDIDTAIITETAAVLRANPEVLATLRYQYSHVFSTHANISGNIVFLERSLSALNANESSK